MKHSICLVVALLLLSLTACQADVCPPDSVGYVKDPSLFPTPDVLAVSGPTPTPSLIEIGGKMIEVDRVIRGPLCNDTWSGSIYVACDIQVAQWTDKEGPAFLKNCTLITEPDTIVYVAAHNNTAYYNGCSICHTGEEPQ